MLEWQLNGRSFNHAKRLQAVGRPNYQPPKIKIPSYTGYFVCIGLSSRLVNQTEGFAKANGLQQVHAIGILT